MSAASPAPLPRQDPDGSRRVLSVARPAGAPAAPAPAPHQPRVRLVREAEPTAVVLPADAPLPGRPPRVGSAEALERSRRPQELRGAYPSEPAGEPLPDPTRLCCAVVQAAVEGLRGVRPLAQLVRWVTPEVYELLAMRAQVVQSAAVAPSPRRAGIRRVRVFRIGDRVAEATVVVDDGPRVRAVALRVEAHRGRWRATVLEIG